MPSSSLLPVLPDSEEVWITWHNRPLTRRHTSAVTVLSGNGALSHNETTILVVEDEDEIRDLVATCAALPGVEVEASGEALGLACTANPHLIVLDVMLPDLDGFTSAARSEPAGDAVPVIFLTARDDPADKRAGFLGGGDDYLTKPFSLEELRAENRGGPAPRGGVQLDSPRLAVGALTLDENAHRVWRSGEEVTLAHGVPAAPLPDAQPWPRPFQAPDPGACLGLWFRRRPGRRRDLYQLPPPQARRPRRTSNPHGARVRLRP